MSDLHLGERWGEVCTLVRVTFGRQIERAGLDVEDVLQEMALKLIRHEHGPCESFRGRDDGGGWSSWICRATWQVITNQRSKAARRGRYHGIASWTDDPASVGSERFDEDAHAEAMDVRLGWRTWEID